MSAPPGRWRLSVWQPEVVSRLDRRSKSGALSERSREARRGKRRHRTLRILVVMGNGFCMTHCVSVSAPSRQRRSGRSSIVHQSCRAKVLSVYGRGHLCYTERLAGRERLARLNGPRRRPRLCHNTCGRFRFPRPAKADHATTFPACHSAPGATDASRTTPHPACPAEPTTSRPIPCAACRSMLHLDLTCQCLP